MTKLPWFQWWPDHHARVTRGWPPLARLAYRELIDHQWTTGALPEDSEQLRSIVPDVSKSQWAAIWSYIDLMFPLGESGRINLILEQLRKESTAKHESRSRAASTAARKRWDTEFEQ